MTDILKYELKVKGMTCSYCSNKVESTLRGTDGVKAAIVNLITEMALVTVTSKDVITNINQIITSMGFKIPFINEISQISANRYLLFDEPAKEVIQELFRNTVGIKGIKTINQKYTRIEYDQFVIQGVEIYNILENSKIKYNYINNLNYSINEITSFSQSLTYVQLLICLIFTALLMTSTMFVHKTSFGQWIMDIILFEGISLYLIIILLLAGIIIIMFGIRIYIDSFFAFLYFRVMNMNTLIASGSTAAILLTFMNLYNLISNSTESHLIHKYTMFTAHSAEAAAAVVAISILGKWVEEHAKKNIRSQSKEMFSKQRMSLGQKITWMKPANKSFDALEEKVIDVGLLEKDNIVKITQGSFILFDAMIVAGSVKVNENIVFGYDNVQKMNIGDKIKSGSEIYSGDCVARVIDIIEECMLYKVTSEMSQSLSQKLNFQHFIDKIINFFVPTVFVLAMITLTIWSIIKIKNFDPNNLDTKYLTWTFVFERCISILVVSCPCAFGLAIPTVTIVAINKALQCGILIKNLSILPEIRLTNAVVLDKTGTITEVIKGVNIAFKSSTFDSIPIWEIISKVESQSRHPIAEILLSYSLQRLSEEKSKITSTTFILNKIEEEETKSNGIKAKIFLKSLSLEKSRIGSDDVDPEDDISNLFYIGNRKFIEENLKDCKIKDHLSEDLWIKMSSLSSTVIYLFIADKLLSILTLDTSSLIRKYTSEIIHLLKKDEITPFILSGDSVTSVHEVGKEIGITIKNCIGEADNKHKKEFLQNLKAEKKVLMIGDGINDILSLSEADFGVSFNASSQLNLIASDVIFIKQDLSLILSLIKLSKLTYYFIWINIFWAFSYNICMIPITTGALNFFWKLDISPTAASFSMLCSSLLIILSSYIMRFFKIDNFVEDIQLANYKPMFLEANSKEKEFPNVNRHNSEIKHLKVNMEKEVEEAYDFQHKNGKY